MASEPLLGYRPVAVVCPDPGARLVNLGGGQVAAPTALSPGVREFLARPGPYQLVGVLGDRVWESDRERSVPVTFLGRRARLP